VEDSEEKTRRELYAETRRDLLTRQLSNSEKFDGAVLTLSTAALGLSLTFLRDVVPLGKAQCLSVLVISWCLFGLAIFSTMASFLASQLGIKRQLEYAEEYYLNKKDDFLTKENFPAKLTEVINYISGFMFVAGILFTILFVATNLRGA